MADLKGYYSGVKEGQEILKTQQQMNLQQMAAQREQADFERAEQEREVTSRALNATQFDRLTGQELDADSQLAQQFINAGREVSKYNPKAALDYIQQGAAVQNNALNKAGKTLELKAARAELQGEVAAQVFDQTSADEAIAKMAELGAVVPERYRQFTPESKEWWKRRALQSKSYIASTKLQIDQLKLENAEKNTESLIQDRLVKQKQKDKSQELARERIASGSKSGLKFPNKVEMKDEIKLLAEADERFDDLDSTLQKALVKDSQSIALSYLKEDPSMGQDEALRRGRRDALSRINDEGQYKVVADKAKPAPDLGSWLPAAMKANPTMSEKEIRAIYQDKYGAK